MYFIYMIECKDKSLYTGITTDLKRRFLEHKAGKGGHYTRSRGVKKVVYSEKSKNRSLASKRESQIKKLKRAEKILLIKSK